MSHRPPGPAAPEHFAFRFDRSMVGPAFAVGVVPATADVEVGPDDLRIRFGPWRLHTPLENVTGAEVTGGYSWVKVAGAPRLSLADSGITFATTTSRGVCIGFRRRVPAALPLGLVRHEGATVTVADPEGLAALLRNRMGSGR